MNYRLLVADEEELVYGEVRSKLKALDIEFEEVRVASSTQEAWELLKDWNCHIVMVSNQMFDKSGVDFIEWIRTIYPHLKFIMLDNSRDFECAIRAMELDVCAYLVKPLSDDKLRSAMTKLFRAMQKDEYLEHVVKNYNIAEKEKKEYRLEKEMHYILSREEGQKISQEACSMLFEKYRWLFVPENYYYVAFIGIRKCNFFDIYGKEDLELLRFSIKNVFNELQSGCEKMIVNKLDCQNQLVCLLGGSDETMLRKEVKRIFLEMENFFEVKLKVQLCIGVSEAAKGLEQFKYKQALDALEYGMSYGWTHLFFYKDVCDVKKFQFPIAELTALRQHLERRNVEKIEKVIDEIFSMKRVTEYHNSYIHVMWMNILSILMQIVEADAYSGNIGGKIIAYYSLNEERYSVAELKRNYINLVLEYTGYKSLEEYDAKNKVKMSVHYLEQYYYSDISVNQLAERYDMTPNYFSSIFKKEIGQSAVNYITNLRISKAKELLEESDKSVVEIAELIGFNDSNYFFRVFKKKTGVTPQKYRVIISKTEIGNCETG